VVVTLGNHDLYTLALGYKAVQYDGKHTLQKLFEADDLLELLEWLRSQSIFYQNEALKFVVSHAGIAPQWSIAQAKHYAGELEAVLHGPDFLSYLEHIEGFEPASWSDSLKGFDRLRYITNAFTRMRYCDAKGGLEFNTKDSKSLEIPGYKAWYAWPRNDTPYHLCFGHWASLEGECPAQNIHALDTGCVYGGPLTAWRAEDQVLIQYQSTRSPDL
jgi:bis(5'-nucleosyl)-tetraphosphatase (symmetrical)